MLKLQILIGMVYNKLNSAINHIIKTQVNLKLLFSVFNKNKKFTYLIKPNKKLTKDKKKKNIYSIVISYP